MVGVVARGEAADRYAGNALQRLGHRPVGQRADILRGDRIDDCVRIALDVLRIGKACADAGDDDVGAVRGIGPVRQRDPARRAAYRS